jgi:hypothetical protein
MMGAERPVGLTEFREDAFMDALTMEAARR